MKRPKDVEAVPFPPLFDLPEIPQAKIKPSAGGLTSQDTLLPPIAPGAPKVVITEVPQAVLEVASLS